MNVSTSSERHAGRSFVCGAALAALVFCAACGSAASETAPSGGGGSSGGASGGAGGVSATDDGGGGGGSGGTADAPGAMACEPKGAFTLAIHIVLDVSWEGTLGGNAGAGKFHLWNLARMTANGATLTGTTQACGNALPQLSLKPLVGGGMVLVEVPHAIWDMPTAPKFATEGTLSGWTAGATLMTKPIVALVGLTMPDPEATWPASYTMITPTDTDGDGEPGITGAPKVGAGYVQTPVSTPILGLGPKADKLFLVSRTGLGLNGKMTTCTEQSGTVTVKFFDNHVVGCHVSGGDRCTPAQIDFVDSNRTKYVVAGGTFTSRIVADDATCAIARAL